MTEKRRRLTRRARAHRSGAKVLLAVLRGVVAALLVAGGSRPLPHLHAHAAAAHPCNTAEQALRLAELRTSVEDPFGTLASWEPRGAVLPPRRGNASSVVSEAPSLCGGEGGGADFAGVTCDPEGCVTALDLSAANLRGNVGEVLRSLARAVGPSLRSLSLGQNELTGTLPGVSQWWHVGDEREADVEDTAAPMSRAQMRAALLFPALTHLNLDNNRVEGTLLDAAVTLLNRDSPLTHLRAFGNRLTGTIPPEVVWLPALDTLSLGGNRLTGSIPEELLRSTTLRFLWLEDNKLTGFVSLVAFTTPQSQLMSLRLSHNTWLRGCLPLRGCPGNPSRVEAEGTQVVDCPLPQCVKPSMAPLAPSSPPPAPPRLPSFPFLPPLPPPLKLSLPPLPPTPSSPPQISPLTLAPSPSSLPPSIQRPTILSSGGEPSLPLSSSFTTTISISGYTPETFDDSARAGFKRAVASVGGFRKEDIIILSVTTGSKEGSSAGTRKMLLSIVGNRRSLVISGRILLEFMVSVAYQASEMLSAMAAMLVAMRGQSLVAALRAEGLSAVESLIVVTEPAMVIRTTHQAVPPSPMGKGDATYASSPSPAPNTGEVLAAPAPSPGPVPEEMTDVYEEDNNGGVNKDPNASPALAPSLELGPAPSHAAALTPNPTSNNKAWFGWIFYPIRLWPYIWLLSRDQDKDSQPLWYETLGSLTALGSL